MSEQLVTPENVTTKDGKINLLDLNRQQMREFFKDLGEKPFRADQVMKWMYHYCCDNFDEMTDITFSHSLCLIIDAMLASIQELLKLRDEQLSTLTADFESRLPEYLKNALHRGESVA